MGPTNKTSDFKQNQKLVLGLALAYIVRMETNKTTRFKKAVLWMASEKDKDIILIGHSFVRGAALTLTNQPRIAWKLSRFIFC